MHEINKRTAGTLPAVQPDLEYIPVVDYRITCNNGNQRTLINP